MKRLIILSAVLTLVLSACDTQGPQLDADSGPAAELHPRVSVQPGPAKNGEISDFLVAVNADLARSGLGIAVSHAEFVTAPDGGQAGQTVYAFDRSLRLSSKWVANDARRAADGENITYLNTLSLNLNLANPSIDSEGPIDASFATYSSTQCSVLPIVKRPDTGVWPSALLTLGGIAGDPFVADIVELGFLPGSIFDLVLGPGAGTNVLGVTFTFIFGSYDSNGDFTPSDINNDGHTDTALKEIWYNNAFTWTDTGSGGIDIETVALHENGHALEMGHFGKVAVTGNGKLHVSPRAVMNAIILGVQRELLGTDNAAYCGNFASWPND